MLQLDYRQKRGRDESRFLIAGPEEIGLMEGRVEPGVRATAREADIKKWCRQAPVPAFADGTGAEEL